MHRIIKAHLDSFIQSRGLEAEEESAQFEKFSNFSIISSISSASFDLDDVTTGAGEDGIDGIAIIIDEEVVISAEDAKAMFQSTRRNHEVDVICIQSKRSEGFDLGDFLKFKEAILRFANQTPYACTDDTLRNAREIFDVIVENVPKIRNGRPNLTARYVATGLFQSPAALVTAMSDFKPQVNDLGLFDSVDGKFIDRDELTRLWVGTYSGTDASLDLFSNAALPTIAGIDEAYLAVVRASDFVENLLTTEDDNLRTQVFEENVRSFLGLDNSVNLAIQSTLQSGEAASRFPVLNNGITIASPDVRLQGNTLHLKNFQIVNGCQTSNVLFENRNDLGDIMVNIKVVETNNEDVFSELVRATNSQSKIENAQFLSLRPVIKRVEQYFGTYPAESRLYFERRDRQYVGQDVPAIRIFSMHNAAKCVAAMYCNRPELASRYPKAMYEELTEVIFADGVKENIFYAACLTMYRFSLLVSNGVIPQNMKRFKWHILSIVRAMISGKESVALNSRQASSSADAVIAKMAQHGAETTEIFVKAVDICHGLGVVSADRLKRQAILAEMLTAV